MISDDRDSGSRHHDHDDTTTATRPADTGPFYICPMHPEIEQIGPGTCPICGMALEPKNLPAVDDRPNPELVDFTHRFQLGVLLSVRPGSDFPVRIRASR